MKNRSKVLLVLLVLLMIPSMVFAAEFSDTEGHWAENYINWASSNKYVIGYPEGKFDPEGNITKAEFITILNRFVKEEKKVELKFEDVKDDSWYKEEVEKAVANGYLENEGKFDGDSFITRDLASLYMYKATKLEGDKEVAKFFLDSDKIENLEAVSVLNSKGILQGYPDNNFLPQINITRAETSKVFYKLAEVLGMIKDEKKPEKPVEQGPVEKKDPLKDKEENYPELISERVQVEKDGKLVASDLVKADSYIKSDVASIEFSPEIKLEELGEFKNSIEIKYKDGSSDFVDVEIEVVEELKDGNKVDKKPLEKALDKASKLLMDTFISKDGKDVSVLKYWAEASEHNDFGDNIADAKKVIKDEKASQEEVDEAVKVLERAIKRFEDRLRMGSQK